MKNSIYKLQSENNKDQIQAKLESLKEMFESEKYKEMLPEMYDFIDLFGFWEQVIDYLNYGDRNEKITKRDGIYSAMWRFAKYAKDEEIRGIADDILVKKETLKNQYYNYNDMELTEIISNIMKLADTIVKIMSNNKNSLDKQKIESKKIAIEFTDIREQCIEKLIKYRNDKQKIMIANGGISGKGKQKLHICIPGYSEPFEAVIIKNEKTEPLISDFDPVFFVKQNEEYLPTTFPIKMTDNQKKIMEYLEKNYQSPELRSVEGRITWFSITDKIFSRARLNNLEVIKKPTISKEKNRFSTTTQGKIKRNKRENTSKDENRDFLQAINERMGGFISDEIIESMLNRASYSMKKLYEQIRMDIDEAIKLIDVPEDEREDESLKVFLYMRMTKPMSKIQKKMLKPEQIKLLIEDSVLEYKEALNLFESLTEQSLQNGQELDYKTIKRMMTRKGDEVFFNRNLPNEEEKKPKITNVPETKTKEINPEDDLVARFRNYIEKLYSKKRELKEEQVELNRLIEELKELESKNLERLKDIDNRKSNVETKRNNNKERIERLEEEKRKIEEEIAKEREKLTKNENELKVISKERENTNTNKEKIRGELSEKEKRNKEIKDELRDIAEKEKEFNNMIN